MNLLHTDFVSCYFDKRQHCKCFRGFNSIDQANDFLGTVKKKQRTFVYPTHKFTPNFIVKFNIYWSLISPIKVNVMYPLVLSSDKPEKKTSD